MPGQPSTVANLQGLVKMSENPVCQRWIPSRIRELKAYQVASAQGLIKLDAMENPYVWDEGLRDAWLERLAGVLLNRYPDPAAEALINTLTKCFSVPDKASLLLGNGSDELIQMVALAVGGPGRVMLAPEPSFSMYQVIAKITGCDYVDVPRHSDFTVDGDALLSAIDKYDPCCVFLACPNNPTGNSCDPALIEKVARASSGIVLVDEAYHAFCGESFMDHAGALDNVLVMRTFSKLGLAALRLGFLAGPKALVDEINKVRLPYNISTLTQVTAEFALEHLNWFEDKAQAICHARESLHKALGAMPGVTAYPSKANFVLFRLPTAKGTIVFESLRQSGVLVKNLHGAHDALSNCLRVTVSTTSQNRVFLDALTASLDDGG